MNLTNRLLRRNLSIPQIVGFALANLLGLAIVMAAIQFYRDATAATSDSDSFISPEYLIVSKKVEGLGSIIGSKVDFSPEDIAELKAQPWVESVGEFTAAAFDVFASVELGSRRMSTSMFLEAIPDEFFDVKPTGWEAVDPHGPIPIIISKDYLTLYNFGYAAARGMPQISEAMLSTIPLRLSLSGNGRQENRLAQVVGFSSRLNTIAIPQSIMDQANAEFASEPLPPSRLIIKLRKAGNPAAKAWVDAHGWETAGDHADNSRATWMLQVAVSVVIAVGAVISVLAFFILLLSIWLLLQKNRDKLHQLLQLGYPRSAVAAPYVRLVAMVNLLILLGAIAITLLAQHAWAAQMEAIGLHTASPWLTIAIGTAIAATLTAANIISIRRKVTAAFPRPQ